MKEVILEEFEDFYKNQIDTKYSKIKKAIRKLIVEMESGLVDIKNSIDFFEEAAGTSLGDKAKKSLKFFMDRLNKEINEIDVPDENEVNHDKLMKLGNSIKKFFTAINETARKSLPKFQKEVQPQIKELNYLTRKLQKKLAIFDEFIRKKYGDVKNAEDLIKKRVPKIFTLKDNIEHAKKDLNAFEEEFEERKSNQEKLNNSLIELEKDQLFKELEKEKSSLFQLKIKVNDELSFKKALKKMKVEVEKQIINIPGIDLNYLRDFLKNPITVLTSDSKDLQKFSSLLVKLRHALEDNKLNLKTDKKEKTIEHINHIFDEKHLHTNIEKVKELNSIIKDIESKIEKAGLAKQLENIKNQVSSNAVKLEHVENALNKKNDDFTRYLNFLKTEREELQKLVEEEFGIPLKINITFTF